MIINMPFKPNDISKKNILQAALKCFLQKGISATTIVDIGKEVGCNKALIYYYFGSKEGLVKQLILEHLEQIARAFNLDNHEPGTIIEAFGQIKSQHRDFLKFLLIESHYHEEWIVESLKIFLEERKINLQQQFLPLVQNAKDPLVSNLSFREFILLLMGMEFSDVMFAPFLEAILNVSPAVREKFFQNYREFSRKILEKILS